MRGLRLFLYCIVLVSFVRNSLYRVCRGARLYEWVAKEVFAPKLCVASRCLACFCTAHRLRIGCGGEDWRDSCLYAIKSVLRVLLSISHFGRNFSLSWWMIFSYACCCAIESFFFHFLWSRKIVTNNSAFSRLGVLESLFFCVAYIMRNTSGYAMFVLFLST